MQKLCEIALTSQISINTFYGTVLSSNVYVAVKIFPYFSFNVSPKTLSLPRTIGIAGDTNIVFIFCNLFSVSIFLIDYNRSNVRQSAIANLFCVSLSLSLSLSRGI